MRHNATLGQWQEALEKNLRSDEELQRVEAEFAKQLREKEKQLESFHSQVGWERCVDSSRSRNCLPASSFVTSSRNRNCLPAMGVGRIFSTGSVVYFPRGSQRFSRGKAKVVKFRFSYSQLVASWLTISSTSRKQTATKFANARYFNLTSQQTWPTIVSTKRVKRKLWEAASCCEDLVFRIRIRNRLILWQPCAARIKDLLSSTNGPTFSVLVMLRIETLPRFSPLLKEQRNSSAKECVTRQKSKTRPGNYSRPNLGETSLRAIRVQRHATILRTLHN